MSGTAAFSVYLSRLITFVFRGITVMTDFLLDFFALMHRKFHI